VTPNFKGQRGFSDLPRTQDPDHRKILKRSYDLLLKNPADDACILKDYILICKDEINGQAVYGGVRNKKIALTNA